MSLFALPVTLTDIEQLQLGIGFFTDPAAAASEVAAINANTPGGPTVYSYAVQLLASQISLAQVAMADSALMEGVTVAAGNVAAPATNTLALFTTQFLPPQIANALAHGYNPTVYAAESLGLALSSNAAFNTNYVSLSASAFVSSVATLTSLNANAISGWLANWTAFYTANPTAHPGLTVTQAAYGATFGDAVGTALLNPTPIGPTNMPSFLPSTTTFNTIQNEVYNALKDNGETVMGVGPYQPGVAIGALPQETPLQGEGNAGGVFLTQGIDTPTSGFSSSPDRFPLLNGFTATQANTVLNALPFVVPTSGLSNNTLNTGDNLQTTGAATGKTTLNYTTSNDSAAANPPYALGVTMNGVNALNITNQASGPTDISGNPAGTTTAGFQGSVTGLTTVVNNSSINSVQLGSVGTSLSTALTSYTSNGGSHQNFTAVIAAAALSGGTDAISVTLNGNTGAAANPGSFFSVFAAPIFPPAGTVPVGGTSIKLVFAPDSGANGYETWNIASDNNAFLRLGQGTGTTADGDFGAGIGSANNIVLTGAGSVELSALTAGDFANLKTIDATAETGKVTLTGAAANTQGGYYSAVGSDFSPTANEAGLLTSGGGNTIAPTSIKGSTTAANFVDLSGLTAANIDALAGTGTTNTLTGNTAANIINTLILPNAVVEGTTALAGENGFQTIGVGTALTGGTINLANFTNANEIKLFAPEAINIAAVTVNNGTPTFTVDLSGDTAPLGFLVGFHNWIVNVKPSPSTTDVFNLDMGTAALTNSTGASGTGSDFAPTAHSDTIGFLGLLGPGLTVNGYETVNINVTDGPALPAIISIFTPLTHVPDIIYGGIALTPTVGGGEILNVTGTGDLISLINTVHGAPLANIEYEVGGVPVDANNFIINATETGLLAFGGTNALQVNGATSGGIIMVGGTDTNLLGATLTGSTTGWNALAGSTSADTFNGGTGQFSPFIALQGDVFGTNGGADTVNLAAGHNLNHIDIYGTAGAPDLTVFGLDYLPLADSITSVADLYQPGWGGVGTGGPPTQFGTIAFVGFGPFFAGGTSASQVVVHDFVTGGMDGPPASGDILTFSVGAWGGSVAVPGLAAINGALGLTAAQAVWGLVDTSHANVLPGDATYTLPLSTGATIPAGFDIVEIAQIEPNANALAQYLKTGIGLVYAAAIPGNTDLHTLFAYTDGANVHIANVELANGPGASAGTITTNVVAASDMVELMGVASVTALNGHNIHFLA